MNLIQRDKLERDRINAKNAVEEYVYEMRSKLQDSLVDFAVPQESDQLLKMLDETENWLYEDGENVMRQFYVDRLTSLRSVGDLIEFRAFEYAERAKAITAFREMIMVSNLFNYNINFVQNVFALIY